MAITNDFVGMARELKDVEVREKAVHAAKNGNLLVLMALILGSIADNMSKEVITRAQALDAELTENSGAKSGEKVGHSENVLNAEMQAALQMYNQFMQALSNAIKTYGEANANLARKG